MRLDSFVWSTIAWYQVSSCGVGLVSLRAILRGGASVPPGAVALMRMPFLACSIASDAVSELTPPLAAAYGTRWILRVAIDETLTMTPFFFSSIVGNTARQHHSVGSSERRISASICFSSYCSNGFAQIVPP